MTLIDYEEIGKFDYYRRLIEELDLESEFENVFDESLEEFELEISESRVISQVLDEAPDDYILLVNERSPAYRLLQLPEAEQD
ncbi:hypothetical protein [Halosimplex pelagicum]|uniref:Uncharacterized protein n=1 Tax=Halosimplex pelagicum TaxID=869886 RepID=A0A7D5T5E5_9EURY|nr:hypothetical protein [Halosimplex pelagicum]QLH82308.1 hypothetical protein HZS54_12095 [Halosimplex pelagicum]